MGPFVQELKAVPSNQQCCTFFLQHRAAEDPLNMASRYRSHSASSVSFIFLSASHTLLITQSSWQSYYFGPFFHFLDLPCPLFYTFQLLHYLVCIFPVFCPIHWCLSLVLVPIYLVFLAVALIWHMPDSSSGTTQYLSIHTQFSFMLTVFIFLAATPAKYWSGRLKSSVWTISK